MDATPAVPAPVLFDLYGRVALVIGASRGIFLPHIASAVTPVTPPGIGAACAIALAEAGAFVCLVYRNPAPGTSPNLQTLNTIRAFGGTAEAVYCDLDDLVAVKNLFQKALDIMGGQIHILVNCVGVQRRSPSLDFLDEDWDKVAANTFFVCSWTRTHQLPS